MKKKPEVKPKSVEEMATMGKCTDRNVEKWAVKNGVKKLGTGKRAPYIFYEADIIRFMDRNKKVGFPKGEKRKKR
jgi:hypothetical protein